MYILSPSILAADFNNLSKQLKKTWRAGTRYAHIDVMDGHFVPNISFGLPVLESLAKNNNKLIFDVHLMISEPEKYIERFARAGADIINVHIEATHNTKELLSQIRALSKKAALTVKPETPVEFVYPYLSDVSMVLIMSVEPGFGGQSFMPKALEKAIKLKKYITDNNIDIDIEMDGGITLDNARNILDAGVNVLVAGSSIFDGDVTRQAKMFMCILKEYENKELSKNNLR